MNRDIDEGQHIVNRARGSTKVDVRDLGVSYDHFRGKLIGQVNHKTSHGDSQIVTKKRYREV